MQLIFKLSLSLQPSWAIRRLFLTLSFHKPSSISTRNFFIQIGTYFERIPNSEEYWAMESSSVRRSRLQSIGALSCDVNLEKISLGASENSRTPNFFLRLRFPRSGIPDIEAANTPLRVSGFRELINPKFVHFLGFMETYTCSWKTIGAKKKTATSEGKKDWRKLWRRPKRMSFLSHPLSSEKCDRLLKWERSANMLTMRLAVQLTIGPDSKQYM